MSVKLARLQSLPEPAEPAPRPARRKEPRFATWFEAKLENSYGDCSDVLVAEVSLHGCRIKAEEPWIRAGCIVSIRTDNAPRLQAIVRWVRDGSAGMEFLRPIPPERSEWHELMDAP